MCYWYFPLMIALSSESAELTNYLSLKTGGGLGGTEITSHILMDRGYIYWEGVPFTWLQVLCRSSPTEVTNLSDFCSNQVRNDVPDWKVWGNQLGHSI